MIRSTLGANMAHWVAFLAIGLGIGWLTTRRFGGLSSQNFAVAVIGSVLGGAALINTAPDIARIGSLVTSVAGGGLLTVCMLRLSRTTAGVPRLYIPHHWSAVRVPPKVRTYLLVAYSIALGVFTAIHLGGLPAKDVVLMETRLITLQQSLSVLNAGYPPLLIHCAISAVAPHGFCPAATTDDPGIYLYVPVLAHLLHMMSIRTTLWIFFTGLYALLIAVTPILWLRAFGSWIVAALAPFFLLYGVNFIFYGDIYWISAWVLFLTMPIMFIVARNWTRFSLVSLTICCVVASFASSIRINAGLPVFISCVGLLLVSQKGWARKAALSLLLTLAYLSVQPIMINAVRHYRDVAVNEPGLSQAYPGEHPTWHNIYIGLGYVPNHQGLSWNDAVAFNAAKKVDPSVVLASSQYEAILEHLTIRLIERDPGLLWRNLVAKMTISFSYAIQWFWSPSILFLLGIWIAPGRLLWRRYAWVMVPAFVITLGPPLLTVPYLPYEMGWLASWALIAMLGCSIAIVETEEMIRSRMGAGSGDEST